MIDSKHPANRLARESSPYLLLHAHNPVDWHPWGPEAIATARREDKPIFLSVGYSTCYWCHVMERESFSNPGIAAAMNRAFVNVKVDREERPDLDELYMLATQVLTGQGGWPNSVFLTPKLEPFFAGTYFPPEDKWGRPGFPTVIESMLHAWMERRSDVESQAAELSDAIRRHFDEIEPWTGPLPGEELSTRAADGLRKRFDATWGGFGEAPKFPTPANLWLLGELAADRPDAAMMLSATLDAMARGGLCDQLGGGFHRYATDREWKVPHFEKMLYDNGLLLELYGREHARTGSAEAARVATATADFLARELTSPEGAFWSAIDAETAGREGAYHVWTGAELEQALGPEDTTFLAPILGFAGEPFFEEHYYVLHLPRPLEVAARERRTTLAALLAEIEPLRARLLTARDARPRPATDDKILADWNGTAIAGLAVAGAALGRKDLVERAARAARAVLSNLRAADGTLLHAWRAGSGKVEAFLSDYVFLVRGLLRLAEATGEPSWIDEATRLQDEQTRRLASSRGGFFNAQESPDLLYRTKELFDGALPAANSVAALNLIELAAVTGEERFAAAAESTLRAFAPIVSTHPDGARTMALALRRFARSARGARAAQQQDPIQDQDERLPLKGAGAGSTVASPGRSVVSRAIARRGVELGAANPAGWRELVVRIEIAAGWHLTAAGESPALEAVGAELANVTWPEPVELAEGELAIPNLPANRGFHGQLEIRGRLRADSPRPTLALRFQACGEGACHPEATLDLDLPT